MVPRREDGGCSFVLGCPVVDRTLRCRRTCWPDEEKRVIEIKIEERRLKKIDEGIGKLGVSDYDPHEGETMT